MSNHASKINFFIVGAAKGGTTTVFDRLNSRADVYLSPLKEPNYYSTDIDTSSFSTEFRANTNLDLSSYFAQSPLPVKQIGFIRDEALYDSYSKALLLRQNSLVSAVRLTCIALLPLRISAPLTLTRRS